MNAINNSDYSNIEIPENLFYLVSQISGSLYKAGGYYFGVLSLFETMEDLYETSCHPANWETRKKQFKAVTKGIILTTCGIILAEMGHLLHKDGPSLFISVTKIAMDIFIDK